MRYQIRKYLIFLLVPFLSSCWFNPYADDWKDVISLESDNIDFSSNETSTIIRVQYQGLFDEVDYLCRCNCEWLSIENPEGNLKKNDFHPINLYIDRSLLNEGTNEAKLEILIDKQHYLRVINISAEGTLEIQGLPDEILFGNTTSKKEVSIHSLSGTRTITLTSPAAWIKVTPNKIKLEEASESNLNEAIVKIECDRSTMSPGNHSDILTVRSEKGTLCKQIKVAAAVYEQDKLIQQCDGFEFSIEKVPYRNGNNCEVQLKITNFTSMTRTLILNTANSSAQDKEGNTYRMIGNYAVTLIKNGDSATMTITIRNVPETVTSFKTLTFDFDLSSPVIFENIKF